MVRIPRDLHSEPEMLRYLFGDTSCARREYQSSDKKPLKENVSIIYPQTNRPAELLKAA